MISVEEAVKLILSHISPLPGEEIPILSARGRVLMRNVHANRNVPPFANSAMDGFAVQWADIADASEVSPAILKIIEVVPAGYVAKNQVKTGTAVRIMTGAPVPRGADTIIRVEHTESSNGKVYIAQSDGKGIHIRNAGEDIRKTQVILEQGKVLTSADIGLLASVGNSHVRVHRKSTVAVISTGDELLGVDDPPMPGKIVNSNSYTLSASVEEAGGIPKVFGIVRDKRKNLSNAFKRALQYDAVVVSGGVSVGDYDFVKEALGDVGVKMQFWKVAQRPGHPMAFGHAGKKPVFGLPGNPVSSALSFFLYTRPSLLKMMGHRDLFLPVIQATLDHEIKSPSGLKEFVRCRIRDEGGRSFVTSTGTQSSGVLRSMSLAQGLIVAHEEDTRMEKGCQVPVILFHHHDFLKRELGF